MKSDGLVVAAGLCLAVGSTAYGAALETGSQRVTLDCEAVYMPARSVWTRTVEIEYDGQRVRRVRIDGQVVYTFAIAGTFILTSQDNERIRIDTAEQTWSSDFRGLASAQGHCMRTPYP